MKYVGLIVIGLISVAVFVGGCSQRRSMSNVRKSFPNAEIVQVPDSQTDWLVLESNTVYLVYDDGWYARTISVSNGEDCIEIFRNVCR